MTQFRFAALALISLSFFCGHQAIEQASAAPDDTTDKPAVAKKLDRAELEKQFEETLSGATLIGSFTVSGMKDQKLTEEKYTIDRVKKITSTDKEDLWQFQTRIQYGGHDVTVPLALEVKWAGDTPVITLTDLMVPGLGTFTARVLIFRGEYAGTWSGGDHGGHLFGRIVKKGESTDAPTANAGAKKDTERQK